MTTSREFPASSLQRQFWLLQQVQPQSTAYHVPALFHIRGPLDAQALARALLRVSRRHDALRTTLSARGSELVQVVHDALLPELQIEDDAQAAGSAAFADEFRRPFDLAHGPLLRMRLWPAQEGGHWLAWTMHHSICDLASKTRLTEDLAYDYAQELGTEAPGVDLAPAPAPAATHYPLFALAERELLASEVGTRSEEYFAEYLRADHEPLALPEDFARPKLQSSAGACVHFELPPALVTKLEARSTELATKPFLLLLTAYGALLARYSCATRVVLGVPFGNRRHPTSHDTVGCFVNNLPLVIDLDGDPSFAELCRRVRAAMLGHHRHQELPFERIVARHKRARDSSRNPIFQAGFTFEPPPTLTLAGAEVQSIAVHAGGAQLDVFMTLWQTGNGFAGRLEYCSDLFERATIERLLRCYFALLEHALSPEVFASTAASRVPWLAAQDRELVVHGFNQTQRDYAAPRTMHEAFLAQCARTPNAIALVFGEREVTYGELCASACGLAQQLHDLGVRPGDRVALFMERSLEMVTAVYATLLAGAAYVPLDPDFPAQRLAFMLEDATPRLVFTHAPLVARCPRAELPVHSLDFDTLPRADRPPPMAAGERDPAYVIFTSGSTGRPKGVPNTHRGICNRILWMQEAYALGHDDVVLQKTPYSFDVSTWEFFWPLTVGARLVIALPGAHRDPAALARVIEAARVTTIHFVPSMLDAFVAHPAAARCVGLRRIFCSGEALSAALVRRTAELLPAQLHNLYGPTEAAVDVSAWACREDLARDPVPIGKPIANTRLYVLDAHRQPVPVGVLGELYIAGVQVALGYINRPDLTAERFVPDPFGEQSDGRMYRTGDLARWQADGNLSYAGRLDHQVKVRGQRIELGEIEAVLDQCSGVRQSVVVARHVGAQDVQLVAYVLPSAAVGGNAAELVQELRVQLSGRLPASMLPTHIMIVSEFPLTASGKLDRKALPEPVLARSQELTAPSDALQAWLVGQWSELLGETRIGVHDNVFELGGTSLMCAQLIGRIREHLGTDVPLVRLFEHPSIAALALHLGALAVEATSAASAPAPDAALDRARERATRQRASLQRPPARKPR